MDSLYVEYKDKHAFVVGVSDGQFAGGRVVDHVKPVLVELNLILHKTALYIGNVDTAFDAEGNPNDETVQKRAEKFVDEVLKVA